MGIFECLFILYSKSYDLMWNNLYIPTVFIPKLMSTIITVIEIESLQFL